MKNLLLWLPCILKEDNLDSAKEKLHREEADLLESEPHRKIVNAIITEMNAASGHVLTMCL